MERHVAKYLEQRAVLYLGGKAYWAECIEYDNGTAENVLTEYLLSRDRAEGGTIISLGRLDQITGNTWARDEVMELFTQWRQKHPHVIGIKRPDYKSRPACSSDEPLTLEQVELYYNWKGMQQGFLYQRRKCREAKW